MLKFRETLWFKKGELDARHAAEAAEGGDDLAPGAADLLPVEDRYRDDGSLSRTDSHAFGVHSGTTSWIRQTSGSGVAAGGYGEEELVREMRRSTAITLIVLGSGLLALGAVVASFL
jgi:hypothetical protein